jgi:hypothetical protein
MRLFRFLICIGVLVTSSHAIAISNNPFDKAVTVSAGSDVRWQYGEQKATKSVKGADGTWYHLFYDGLRLRLRLTGSAEDSQYGARQFEDFAVNDVRIDGNRVELFQWCLNNQDKHSRFLQQGLTVKKEICQNQGEQGTFIMRLTKDTITALNSGNVIEYELKPFRTTVKVKFNIDDFDQVNSEFKRQQEAKLAASKAAKEKAEAEARAATAVTPAAVATVAKPKPKPKARCMVGPPEGFSEVKVIEYNCDDAAARSRAQASVDSKVSAIKAQRKKAAAEAERKRKEAEAARLAKEEALKKEQEALAASAALRAELSSDIAKKMIAVCEKKWAEGEHRCYCEKYIQFAPPNITSNPDCK